MLLFKKRFLPAIREGRKTQSIRLWPYRRMRSGQRSYIPGAGYIRVIEVTEVALDELTDEDATLDGLASAAELRAELTQLYAEPLVAGHQAYRVRFELLPDAVKITPSRDVP